MWSIFKIMINCYNLNFFIYNKCLQVNKPKLINNLEAKHYKEDSF